MMGVMPPCITRELDHCRNNGMEIHSTRSTKSISELNPDLLNRVYPDEDPFSRDPFSNVDRKELTTEDTFVRTNLIEISPCP